MRRVALINSCHGKAFFFYTPFLRHDVPTWIGLADRNNRVRYWVIRDACIVAALGAKSP
jgi:hypothetical protein